MSAVTSTTIILWLLGAAVAQSDPTPVTIPGLEGIKLETAEEVYKRLSQKPIEPPAVDSEALRLALEKFPQISVSANIMYFSSWQHFHAAKDYLNAKSLEFNYKAYLAAKAAPDPKKPPRFNSHQVREEFEDLFKFNSLRRKVETEFMKWIRSNQAGGHAASPHKGQIRDANVGALLNNFGEVNIDKVFYRFSLTGAQAYPNYLALVVSRRSDNASPSPKARRLQMYPSPEPMSYCYDSVFDSRADVGYSGRTKLYSSISYTCVPTDGGACEHEASAEVRLFSKTPDVDAYWEDDPGVVYANIFGRFSQLTYLDQNDKVYENLCIVGSWYNIYGYNFKYGNGNAKHTIKTRAKTNIFWTYGNFYGVGQVMNEYVSNWWFNA